MGDYRWRGQQGPGLGSGESKQFCTPIQLDAEQAEMGAAGKDIFFFRDDQVSRYGGFFNVGRQTFRH